MFGKAKDRMGQFQMIQKMMQGENFKAFISHPKIQTLLKDPEFLALLKTQDFNKITLNPKFSALRGDQDLAALASKLNFPR